jgi:large subunit ribosomal protein L34e
MPIEKRGRSAKARQRVSPGGRRTKIYKLKKPSPALCGLCHARLNAVPRRAPPELGKLSKTERRPERLFGGVLCSRCSAQVLKEAARLKYGAAKRESIPITHLRYVAMLEKASKNW